MTKQPWVREIIDNRKNYRRQELKCCGSCKYKHDNYEDIYCKLAYSIIDNKILHLNDPWIIETFGETTIDYENVHELNICDAFEQLAEGE